MKQPASHDPSLLDPRPPASATHEEARSCPAPSSPPILPCHWPFPTHPPTSMAARSPCFFSNCTKSAYSSGTFSRGIVSNAYCQESTRGVVEGCVCVCGGEADRCGKVKGQAERARMGELLRLPHLTPV